MIDGVINASARVTCESASGERRSAGRPKPNPSIHPRAAATAKDARSGHPCVPERIAVA